MTMPPRVLVIDDDPSIRSLYADVAREVGYDAIEIAGLREAEPHAFGDDVGIVLLDLTLPGRDGVEILRSLAARKIPATVLLVSGHDHRTIASAHRVGVELGLAMGPSLQKPVAVEDLEAALVAAARPSSAIVRPAGDEASDWRPSPPEIERALAEGEFEVHFQPKIGLRGREAVRVVGAEALVRWRHPTRGLVGPHAFVPTIEASGFVASFTDAVIARSIAARRAWEAACGPLPVSLNVSRALLTDLALPDRIEAALATAGLGPEAVMIEITETAAMADFGKAADIVTRLRLKGIAISLDDFGTGFGTLAEIYRLPISELKIDRSLVAEVERDDDADLMVRALTGLAHGFGLAVCAEGVETMATVERLIAAGCDSAQGYFYSRPLPFDAFVAFAGHRSRRPEPEPSRTALPRAR